MSSLSDDTGGPAFPHDKYMKNGDQWGTYAHGGMSLRDYFAAAALPALIAATSAGQHAPNRCYGESLMSAIAKDAYALADAMIAARQEPQS